MPVMYAMTDPSLDQILRADGLYCAFVEGPAEAQFLDIRDEDFRAMALDFPSGVAFGPTREVRWLKRRDGKLHVVVIDDGATSPEGVPSLPLEALPGEQPSQLLLMGERSTGRHFLEGRIPDDLEYPDDSGEKHLAVEIRHYSAEQGARRLWRCVRLKGAR